MTEPSSIDDDVLDDAVPAPDLGVAVLDLDDPELPCDDAVAGHTPVPVSTHAHLHDEEH